MKDPDLERAMKWLRGRKTPLAVGECVDVLICLEKVEQHLDSIEEVTFYRYKED